jgi:hypothetical protein
MVCCRLVFGRLPIEWQASEVIDASLPHFTIDPTVYDTIHCLLFGILEMLLQATSLPPVREGHALCKLPVEGLGFRVFEAASLPPVRGGDTLDKKG